MSLTWLHYFVCLECENFLVLTNQHLCYYCHNDDVVSLTWWYFLFGLSRLSCLNKPTRLIFHHHYEAVSSTQLDNFVCLDFQDLLVLMNKYYQHHYYCDMTVSLAQCYYFACLSGKLSLDHPMFFPMKFEDTGQDIGYVLGMSSKYPKILNFTWKNAHIIQYFLCKCLLHEKFKFFGWWVIYGGLYTWRLHQTGIQMSRQDILSVWFEDIFPCPGHSQLSWKILNFHINSVFICIDLLTSWFVCGRAVTLWDSKYFTCFLVLDKGDFLIDNCEFEITIVCHGFAV